MAVSANRLELLQIADAVAREKVIDREIVLAAMADAIQKAARSRYGSESNIRADINSAYRAVRDPNAYSPGDFRASLGRAIQLERFAGLFITHSVSEAVRNDAPARRSSSARRIPAVELSRSTTIRRERSSAATKSACSR